MNPFFLHIALATSSISLNTIDYQEFSGFILI